MNTTKPGLKIYREIIAFSQVKKIKVNYKLTAKTVDEEPASCKRWISRKEI